ncbi:hypothetical protein ACFFRS_27300, partial [Saccharopolyspora hordei]|uniref:hypothetical protein n=1 Tax=Saccharopolyspora hordei TaxID=1838 RepID=UPI0035E597B6
MRSASVATLLPFVKHCRSAAVYAPPLLPTEVETKQDARIAGKIISLLKPPDDHCLDMQTEWARFLLTLGR